MKPIPTQDERQLLWERVNDTVLRCSEKLVSAKIAADFSGIGHACRDGLTTLAQAIWDPERHLVTDIGKVGTADVKRKFDAYFSVEYGSSDHEEMRKLAKAAFDLANTVQHRANASFPDAALAMEAFAAVVNIVAIAEKRCDVSRPWEITRSSPSVDQLMEAAVASRHNLSQQTSIAGIFWDTILMPGSRLDIQIFPSFSLYAGAEVPGDMLDQIHTAFLPDNVMRFDERPMIDGWNMWAPRVPGPNPDAPHRFSMWCSRIANNAVSCLITSIADMEAKPGAIDGYAVETYITTHIQKFSLGYRKIGISGPAIISVSLLDVLNKELVRSRPSDAKGFNRQFVTLPDLRVSDIACVSPEDLSPFIDKLWRAAGWRGGTK